MVTKKFIIILIIIITPTILAFNIKIFGEDHDTFLYGQYVDKIVFCDFKDDKVNFPPEKTPSVVFFVSNTQRDIKLLNEIFYVIDQIKTEKKIYIFVPELKDDSTLIQLNKNLLFTLITKDKNKDEKQKTFISKVCSKCFSMMIVINKRIKYFRQGYDYYLFKEVLNNLLEEK